MSVVAEEGNKFEYTPVLRQEREPILSPWADLIADVESAFPDPERATPSVRMALSVLSRWGPSSTYHYEDPQHLHRIPKEWAYYGILQRLLRASYQARDAHVPSSVEDYILEDFRMKDGEEGDVDIRGLREEFSRIGFMYIEEKEGAGKFWARGHASQGMLRFGRQIRRLIDRRLGEVFWPYAENNLPFPLDDFDIEIAYHWTHPQYFRDVFEQEELVKQPNEPDADYYDRLAASERYRLWIEEQHKQLGYALLARQGLISTLDLRVLIS